MKHTIIMLGILAVLLVVPMAHADITTGLQGYWKFDHNLRDQTDNYNDGIAVGTISYTDGYLGQGVHTDNPYSAVNVGNDSSLSINDSITIAMWVMVGEYASGGFLVSKSTWYGAYDEMSMGMSTASYDNYIYFVRDNIFFFAGGDEPNCCGWYHVVLTSDENQSRFYINGTLVEEGAGIVTATKSINPLWIGNFNPEGAYGQDIVFDEVRIYNRTLSYDDVEELFNYNGTTPTTTTTVPSNTSLLPLSNLTISVITGNIIEPTSSYCVDNSTLRKVQDTTIQTEGGDYSTSKYTEFTCDFGCVQTSPSSAECTPKPLDLSLWFIVVVVAVFMIILGVIGFARR